MALASFGAVSNGIEVIYNHVILVLRASRCRCRKAASSRCWAATARARRPRCAPSANLLAGERRGDQARSSCAASVSKTHRRPGQPRRGAGDGGAALLCPPHHRGEPADRRLHARDGKAAVAATLEKVYNYFPRLKTRRTSQAAYLLGRRAADVRHRPRADGQPEDGAARRAVDGPAPQIVEVFEIVKDLNHQGGGLPARRAEHQHRAALRRLRLHPRERPHRDGRRGQGLRENEGRQGVLPRHGRRRPQELPRREELQSAASAGWRDDLWRRSTGAFAGSADITSVRCRCSAGQQPFLRTGCAVASVRAPVRGHRAGGMARRCEVLVGVALAPHGERQTHLNGRER